MINIKYKENKRKKLPFTAPYSYSLPVIQQPIFVVFMRVICTSIR